MKQTIIILFLSGLLLSACKQSNHFISDAKYRELVESQYQKQKELASGRSSQLFQVMDGNLTRQEEEAMKFLYAFMPLSDLADYTGEFYLANVRESFAAKDTFAWGKTVPEELFRHFVLPIRVNNENLDTSRMVFFRELKARVRNKSMKEAVLEVNHWCHEKVTYRGTDGRTSSPLSTVKTAYGRCGEESTFTVAALRSVGIPARQCYTPRWAHSDDNHAWVEVWADGKWYYIGACEPEPELNMAWFTGPAKRAMLVNTNVFGVYNGPEDILVKDERYTKINILTNYTTVKRLFVKVIDVAGKPSDSAVVEFQLYNYAEFYPLHKAVTDEKGLASFQTGLGDLLVWASGGEKFGFSRADVRSTDTVWITLDKKAGYTAKLMMDFVPPAKQEGGTDVPDSIRKVNTERLALEDKIRAGYEETFMDSAKAFRLAVTLNLDAQTLWKYLRSSRGNWRELVAFIQATPENKRQWIFPLLENLSDKDLRDADPAVLTDHLMYSETYSPLVSDQDLFAKYILTPRFDNEFLKPWKQYFQEKFGKDFIEKARRDPGLLVTWVKDSIAINLTANYGRAPLTPVGAYELRVADPSSRNMLFTALCRSFGIPARIETATKMPQYYASGEWKDVWFEEKQDGNESRAELTLMNDKSNKIRPEYYIHYTIEQFQEGFYRSLDYETDPSVKEFPCTIKVLPGSYLLVTGNRVGEGTVLASLDFFDLPAGLRKNATILLRNDPAPLPVYGKTDLSKYFSAPPKNGLIVAFIEPDKEPTKHLLADLKQKQQEFSKWSGIMVLICPTEAEMKEFSATHSKELPSNCSYSFQGTFPISNFQPLFPAGGKSLPVVIFVNSKGEVNYISEGYRIGIGDELLKIIRY